MMLSGLCSILLSTIISVHSRSVPSTEPAFFITLLSLLVSLALRMLPQQVTAKRIAPAIFRKEITLVFRSLGASKLTDYQLSGLLWFVCSNEIFVFKCFNTFGCMKEVILAESSQTFHESGLRTHFYKSCAVTQWWSSYTTVSGTNSSNLTSSFSRMLFKENNGH